MKKQFKVLGVVLGVAAVFALGTTTGANLDWKTTAINNAYSGFLDTAGETTEQLTVDINTDIDTTVQTKISGTVETQEQELQRLLEEYYRLKLDEFANAEEIIALEAQIKTIMEGVLTTYKQRIDEEFANALNGQ